MAATVKPTQWTVSPISGDDGVGDIHVCFNGEDGDYVKINQGDDHSVWLDPKDVPALIDALRTAVQS